MVPHLLDARKIRVYHRFVSYGIETTDYNIASHIMLAFGIRPCCYAHARGSFLVPAGTDVLLGTPYNFPPQPETTPVLTYHFQTDDVALAKRIMDLCGNPGIAYSPAAAMATAAPANLNAPPGYTPFAAVAPAAVAPAAAAPAAPVPAAAPVPTAAPAAPAPAAHDAEDQAVLSQGWSLDAHLKPAVTALMQKDAVNGPAKMAAILGQFGAQRIANGPGALAPKHYPAVHAAITAAAA